MLRTARDLERFADYATDIAERVDFMVTGQLAEVNVDDWERVRQEMETEQLRKAETAKATPQKPADSQTSDAPAQPGA